MFTQEVVISQDFLIKMLLENGYLHESFANGYIVGIEQTTASAQDVIIWNNFKLTVKTKELKDKEG